MVQNQKSGDVSTPTLQGNPWCRPDNRRSQADGSRGSFSQRFFLVTERTELNMTFDPMRRSDQGGCGSQKLGDFRAFFGTHRDPLVTYLRP